MKSTRDILVLSVLAMLFLSGRLVALPAGLPVDPDDYFAGCLSSQTGGIQAYGKWAEGNGTTICWWVWQNGDSSWHYAYEFTVNQKNVSHFILELTEDVPKSEIFNQSWTDSSEIEAGWFAPHFWSNPYMPESMYGIKLPQDSTVVTASFDIYNHGPVWGDFYAKDGVPGSAGGEEFGWAWNTGFTAGDLDPDDPPGDDSVRYHLLVPNGEDYVIPEPVTIIGLFIGLGSLLGYIRKKRMT